MQFYRNYQRWLLYKEASFLEVLKHVLRGRERLATPRLKYMGEQAQTSN